MGPSAQLPHLLRLLDDPSPTVRDAVTRALVAYGPSLEEELGQLKIPATAKQIAQIRQLIDAPKSADQDDAGSEAGSRADETEVAPTDEVSDTAEPSGVEQFAVGELVRHGRYDYRGVVVASDPACRADDDWYLANRTQPDRDQPWYHVLVHGSHQVTYAAPVKSAGGRLRRRGRPSVGTTVLLCLSRRPAYSQRHTMAENVNRPDRSGNIAFAATQPPIHGALRQAGHWSWGDITTRFRVSR